MVGIAGSIDPSLEIGELVMPEVVINYASKREFQPTNLTDIEPRGSLLSGDEYLHEPDVLAELIAQGVVAVDMETAAVAEVCEARGVPWSVFRAISDRASDAGLVGDAILTMVKPDGSVNVPAAARFLITKPHRIPHLVRMGRGSQAAADNDGAGGSRIYPVVPAGFLAAGEPPRQRRRTCPRGSVTPPRG